MDCQAKPLISKTIIQSETIIFKFCGIVAIPPFWLALDVIKILLELPAYNMTCNTYYHVFYRNNVMVYILFFLKLLKELFTRYAITYNYYVLLSFLIPRWSSKKYLLNLQNMARNV